MVVGVTILIGKVLARHDGSGLPEWYNGPGSGEKTVPHPLGGRRPIMVRRALARLGEDLRGNSRLRHAPIVDGSDRGPFKVAGIVLLIVARRFARSRGACGDAWGDPGAGAVDEAAREEPGAGVAGSAAVQPGKLRPAATNLVTPGSVAFTLWSFGHAARIWQWTFPASITITDAGIVVAGRFLLRSIDCVTLSYLLIATTDHAVLLNALRRLECPGCFGWF